MMVAEDIKQEEESSPESTQDSENSSEKSGKEKRKRSNILNMVLFKNHLPYLSLLAFTVCFGVVIYYYTTMIEGMGVVLQASDSDSSSHVIQNMKQFSFVLFYSFISLSFINFVFFMVYNHRTYGASHRIVSYIENNLMNKNYDEKLTLRKGDFLVNVADSLQKFVDKLRSER